MRQLLDARGLRLTRSLGQNFLHDANQLRRIVELARIRPGDRVLEIGPGLGPLTEVLLAAGARVLAIEKDRRLIPILRERLAHHPDLQILEADALDWLVRDQPDLSDQHVVSNLPYSVGSPILVELAQLPLPPTSATVTLQAEVVDRIRARPGTGAYGILSLLLAHTFSVETSFPIPATCFFPVPDVTSACVRLVRRPQPLTPTRESARNYSRLVKLAFSQRRKRVRKVLRAAWPDERLAPAWTALHLSDDARAETLPPGTFADLTHLLNTPVP